MGEELKQGEIVMPTLTLEPVLDEPKAEVTVQPEAEVVKKEMEQTVLSPEEQQMVDSFAKKIDIENTNQILWLIQGCGTGKLNISTHFIGDDGCKGCLSQSRRAL